MPEFTTPFSVKKSERTLTHEELVRAIRFSIASEYEAIQVYEEIAESIDDVKARKMLYEIASDEKVHAGNFIQLLKILEPSEEQYYEEGYKEAVNLLENVV